MQNLSQSDFNQIAEMRSQSRDELEQIEKIRRIKNYEKMTNEKLIISILKSKQSITEFLTIMIMISTITKYDIRRILSKLLDRTSKKSFRRRKRRK